MFASCASDPPRARGVRIEIRDTQGNLITGATISHVIALRQDPAISVSTDDRTTVEQLLATDQTVSVDTLPTTGSRELIGRSLFPGVLSILRAEVPDRLADAVREYVKILAIQAPGFRTILEDRFLFELGALTPGFSAPVQVVTLDAE
ncbi:MAG: hypothetical protein HYY84_17785 [Deltaproteobacteria bacterium]|nr:hypothetical protein [Deltaproteobacteria bacterium]